MIFSMCGLMMRLKWCAWVALYCSCISFANSRLTDDTKQVNILNLYRVLLLKWYLKYWLSAKSTESKCLDYFTCKSDRVQSYVLRGSYLCFTFLHVQIFEIVPRFIEPYPVSKCFISLIQFFGKLKKLSFFSFFDQ